MGAQKFALKAHHLYPELDGLAQMMAALEVHIAAENKVNGDMDWYGILNVNQFADEATVRKQYRKLALQLIRIRTSLLEQMVLLRFCLRRGAYSQTERRNSLMIRKGKGFSKGLRNHRNQRRPHVLMVMLRVLIMGSIISMFSTISLVALHGHLPMLKRPLILLLQRLLILLLLLILLHIFILLFICLGQLHLPQDLRLSRGHPHFGLPVLFARCSTSISECMKIRICCAPIARRLFVL